MQIVPSAIPLMFFFFELILYDIFDVVQLQVVEHSNRQKMKSNSMRRKNTISANMFGSLYFVAISIIVVWLGRFAPYATFSVW